MTEQIMHFAEQVIEFSRTPTPLWFVLAFYFILKIFDKDQKKFAEFLKQRANKEGKDD